MDIVAILRKMQTPPQRMTITLDVERAPEHPKSLQRVRLLYALDGGVPETNARRAIELSITKYCTVANSLSENVTIDWDLRIDAD
jgi:putative redox protein